MTGENPTPIWNLKYTKKALKSGEKIGSQDKKRILNFLESRVANAIDPRSLGSALTGDLSDYWRYRVGDYRIICKIEDETITILVIEIGHRREVYR